MMVDSFDSSSDIHRVKRRLDPEFAALLVSDLLEIGFSGGSDHFKKKQAKTRSWLTN